MQIIFVSILGFVLSGASPPKTDGKQDAQGARHQVASSAPTMAIEQGRETPDLNKPCRKDDEDRSTELCAQWKAVDAAQSSSNATWLFGALGSLVGACALAAAVSAAIWAKEAAKAGRRANRISQLIGQADVGARVSISAVKIDEGPTGLTVIMTASNGGKSNAVSVVITATLNIHAAAGNMTNFVFSSQTVSSIDPGGSRTTAWEYPLTAEQIGRRSGWAETFVYGFLKYEDIFDETTESEFCFRSPMPVDGTLNMRAVALSDIYGVRKQVQQQVDDYRQVPHPANFKEQGASEINHVELPWGRARKFLSSLAAFFQLKRRR